MGEHVENVNAEQTATSQPTPTKPKSKFALYATGTVGIAIVGGILFQIWRANPGEAATPDDSGKVTVSDPAGRAQPVARVGQYQITEAQLVAELKELYATEVLDKIINRTLIQQACESQGIQVTEAEVQQEIQKIAGQFKLDVPNWYKMIEVERGLTPVQYRRDVIWPMLALRKLAGDKLTITEADIQKEFVRSYSERAKVRMILVDNQRRATEIWENLRRKPQEFDRFVEEYSIDANSRPLGGRVPPIPRYSGNEELEKAAFALKPGQISSVIQIGVNRYVILMGDGLTQPVVASLDEVRGEIEKTLRETKEREAAGHIFGRLKDEIRVDNYLTHTSTGNSPTGGPIRQVSGQRPAVPKR